MRYQRRFILFLLIYAQSAMTQRRNSTMTTISTWNTTDHQVQVNMTTTLSKNKSNDDDDDDEDIKSNVTTTINNINSLSVNNNNKTSSNDSIIISQISSHFSNRRTFACPRAKDNLLTGTHLGDLSPEDIGIIATMGDSLATGKGLWPNTDIEFRGAAFPSGGDATIDGLVTVPNILSEFNPRLVGVSHGMGTREQLPPHQLNVAMANATTHTLAEQAEELVRRMRLLKDVKYRDEWALIIVTVGTEEICRSCAAPSLSGLHQAISVLEQGIPKAFIVLLGPIHVSPNYDQKANLLKQRCECSRKSSYEFMRSLSKQWSDVFKQLESYFADPETQPRKTFGVLALPELTIASRMPFTLLIPNEPLLNRKGHAYATKWLWNRLLTGPSYNLSSAVLSEDAFYCPAMTPSQIVDPLLGVVNNCRPGSTVRVNTGCPYFRTVINKHNCRVRLLSEIDEDKEDNGDRPIKGKRSSRHLYMTAVVVVIIAFCSVIAAGSFFYERSKQATRGRFEMTPEAVIAVEQNGQCSNEEENRLLP